MSFSIRPSRRFPVQCAAIFFCGMLLSCAHTAPQASLGDFSDQVLEPLASRLADEHLAQARADISLTYQEQEKRIAKGSLDESARAMIHGLGLYLFGPLGDLGGESLFQLMQSQAAKDASVRHAEYEEVLAWLETRRLPLKRELLDLFENRAVPTGQGFSVCVEDKQRQYQTVEGGRFTRLADGPGPCETTQLQSLNRDAPE
jgi:hypothetical protein